MELFYEGTNITEDVNITAAVARDFSGRRIDNVDITLDHARTWYHWGPQTDDKIEIVQGGYSTGTMYVNSIVPKGDSFRIIATAAKSGAGRRANASFEDKTLEEIIVRCAAECGMDYRIFGIDKRTFYPFLLRLNESCGAFLNRLAEWEGARLKTYSGRFAFVSAAAAQRLSAVETIEVTTKQPGVIYQRKGNWRIKTLTTRTPYGDVSATDEGIVNGRNLTIPFPARDVATAGRWVRGMLLNHNLEAEQLTVASKFHPAWTSLVRVDVTGDTDASGKWIIDECEHDFVNGSSTAIMHRCVDTVV